MKREKVIHVFIRNVTGKFRRFHHDFQLVWIAFGCSMSSPLNSQSSCRQVIA